MQVRRKEFCMSIQSYLQQPSAIPDVHLALTSSQVLEQAQHFHSTIPGYRPTPLFSLDGLASSLGLSSLLIKDESQRFGLNAFKALGGSFAIAHTLAGKLGWSMDEVTFEALMRPEVREKLGALTFVTATDGNHGRGVAWAARLLGHRAVVYMPKGSSLERLENIRAQGAYAEIADQNYDGAVRLADRMAKEKGWILVQDTAWPGYEEIPAWIMQGYTTIAQELFDQLTREGLEPPTHIFLQAGVGSFAGAILGSFAARLRKDCPVTCIVEPDRADCLYRSAKAGKITPVTGDMDSMMAGLCCGDPCTISWEVLHRGASAFFSCSDDYSARGMRLLGLPTSGDPVVVSGESGAVGVGVLAALMEDESLADTRDRLGLGKHSRVLCISTEGDTDQANYRAVLAKEL